MQPGDDERMLYTNPFPHLEGLIPFDAKGGVYTDAVKKVRTGLTVFSLLSIALWSRTEENTEKIAIQSFTVPRAKE